MLMVIIICTCFSQTFGQPFHHYQIITNSFSCKMELPCIGLQLFCFKYWSFSNKVFLKIKSLKKKKKLWEIGYMKSCRTDGLVEVLMPTLTLSGHKDLTPCDFFLWGYIKSKVYDSQPNNMDKLKTKIQNAFGDVTQDMLRNSMVSFQNRLNLVIQSNVRQTEL